MRPKVGLPACALGSLVDPRRASHAAGGRRLPAQHHSDISRTSPSRCPSRTRRDGGHRAPLAGGQDVWRRVLALGAAAAVAVGLWVVVLLDVPWFHDGGPHLPALGPASQRPSPSTLVSPGPSPGDTSNPQAQAGPPGSGSRVTGGGNGAADVEDEPPDVEDEPPTASGGGTTAPTATPAPAPGLVGQNLLPTALPLPKTSVPALPLPTPHLP